MDGARSNGAQAAVVITGAAAAGAGVVDVAAVAPVGALCHLRDPHRCASQTAQLSSAFDALSIIKRNS